LVKELKALKETFNGKEFWSAPEQVHRIEDCYIELVSHRMQMVLNRLKDAFSYVSEPSLDEVIKMADDQRVLDKHVKHALEDIRTFIDDGVFW